MSAKRIPSFFVVFAVSVFIHGGCKPEAKDSSTKQAPTTTMDARPGDLYSGNVLHIAEEKDLPKCESKNLGYVYFIAASKIFVVCAMDGSYQEVDLRGAAGDKGDKGDRGDKGNAGDKGDQGDKGDKGDTGDKGDKGNAGDKGDQGDKGDKGDTGADGATGQDGTSGLNSLIRTVQEDPGLNCSYGGLKILSGLDANRNSQLDDTEATNTAFVCSLSPSRVEIQGILDTDFGSAGTLALSGVFSSSLNGIDFKLSGTNPASATLVVATKASGGGIYVKKVDGLGALAAGFGTNGEVTYILPAGRKLEPVAVAIQSDGKILVMCKGTYGGNYTYVIRFNPNGSVDTGFASDGLLTSDQNGRYSQLILKADGSLLMAGYSGLTRVATMLAYDASGAPLATFGTQGRVEDPRFSEVAAATLNSQGQIVTLMTKASTDLAKVHLVTFAANGSVTTTAAFTLPPEITWFYPNTATPLPNGALLIAGHGFNGSTNTPLLLRLNPDGSLAPDFAANTGLSAKTGRIVGLAVAPDYRIYAVFKNEGAPLSGAPAGSPAGTLMRFRENGHLDTEFGQSGYFYGPDALVGFRNISVLGDRLYVSAMAHVIRVK